VEYMNTLPHPDAEQALALMIHAAQMQERKGGAQAIAGRLDALARKISREALNGVEAAALLSEEADRFAHEAREID